ncbi:unnamed protein product, partial [Didymodactylos carnosus]
SANFEEGASGIAAKGLCIPLNPPK